jgi:putative oxidoreductase
MLALAARVALGGMFAFAAYNKLANPQEFAFSVKAFKILPDHLAVLATFVLPWLEMICGVLLIGGVWTRAAALVGVGQLALFIGGIISVLERGLNVKCGCFGKYDLFCSGPLGWCNVGQNAMFVAIGLVILATGPGRLALSRRT